MSEMTLPDGSTLRFEYASWYVGWMHGEAEVTPEQALLLGGAEHWEEVLETTEERLDEDEATVYRNHLAKIGEIDRAREFHSSFLEFEKAARAAIEKVESGAIEEPELELE